MLRKANLPLILGSIILILLLVIIITPKTFTKINPYGIENIKTWMDDGGNFHIERAPFKPSKTNILGTDEIGRDIFSLIIHGTRLTIMLSVLVVLARFLIAIPMGMSAGFGSFISKAIINQLSVIFSAIPALLISIILLKMDFFVNLYKGHSIIAFVIVLAFVGWSKLGLIIMERVEEILSKPFIKGEIAIGKGNFRIAVQNVVPHLAAELVVLFFMEIARALTMIMQLGIFGVFVGNLRIIEDTTGGIVKIMNISFEPEWASMLGTARNQIRSAPWTVISPAIAFFISVLGFNLFGEGLRMMLQQSDSKFITYLRRILSFDVNTVTRYLKRKKERKAIFKRAGIVVLVIIILFTISYNTKENFNFNYAETLSDFSNNMADRVIIGTDQSEQAAYKLADKMKEMGLEPLHEDGYIVEYETEDIFIPTSSMFTVINNGKSICLKDGKDFTLMSFGNVNLSGRVYDATREDLFGLKDFKKFNGKFVIFDSKFYLEDAVKYFIDIIMKKSNAKGVFIINRDNERLPNSIGKEIYDGVAACITQETAKLLLKDSNCKIDISIKSKQVGSTGRNIVGVMHGENEKVGEEALLFGFGYNYFDKDIGNKRISFALETIKQLINQEKNKNRTLIFAFWDGTIKDEYNGVKAYAENVMYPPKKTVLYFDLTRLYTDKATCLTYGSEQSPISRYFAFSFGHQFEENCKKEGIQIKEYKGEQEYNNKVDFDELLFIKHGLPTLIISMEEDKKINGEEFNLDKLGKVLIKTVVKNNY